MMTHPGPVHVQPMLCWQRSNIGVITDVALDTASGILGPTGMRHPANPQGN